MVCVRAAGQRRRHGFEWPLNVPQVGSWVAFSLLISLFYRVPDVLVKGNSALLVGWTHFSLALLTFGFAVAATRTDPGDLYDASGDGDAADHCYACDRAVRPTSKHCRRCGKCVAGFDHHCVWLNTCVGEHNYHYFLALLASAAVLLLFEAMTTISAIVLFVEANEENEQEDGSFMTFLAFYLGGCAVALCFVLQLLGFHFYLVARQQTTYDYSLRQARAKRARELELARAKPRRPSVLPADLEQDGAQRGTANEGASLSSESDSAGETAGSDDQGDGLAQVRIV